jgi:uracil-DNA glycosylase
LDTVERAHRLGALLAWYEAMGVSCVVDDTAVDWCQRGDVAPGAGCAMPDMEPTRHHVPGPVGHPAVSPSHPATPAPGTRQSNATPQPPTTAPATVREIHPRRSDDAGAPSSIAASARTLDDLQSALGAFEGCGLKSTAKTLCFYRGAPTARLMVIGEAPGRDEDIAGQPFVGPGGQLLNAMLGAISLREPDVHLTNVVYWRPPGNRLPTSQEITACAPFLDRQIELVAPDVVLILGGAAAKQLLGHADAIMKIRGKWGTISRGGREIATMATLHPDYVLRAPASKRQVWRDLLSLRAALANLNTR